MARDSNRSHLRGRIAHLAARLMAEDGIEDYALAKRKAARQAGVPDSRHMPDNDEIDAALKTYRDLYQQDHASHLRELRLLALKLMNEFAAFNPHLTGSILRGSAGKYAGAHLHLYTDNAKSVEHFLFNEGINFRCGEVRLYAGELQLDAPVYSFEREGVEVNLTVLSMRELRSQLKASATGRPIERARLEAVQALLGAN